jgi:formate dehydrogenase subunit gamma
MAMKIRILALLLVLACAAAGPAVAQGTSAAPPLADELAIQSLLRGEPVHGRISIPDQRAANLIQPQGREWREFHNVTLAWVGGVAITGMLALLVGFRLVRGRIMIPGGPSGRTIRRFNALERANHWMVASSFIVLALSGLNLTFGRYILLPVIGPEAFHVVSQLGKFAHNFLSFPFTLGLVVMVLLWAKDNIPNKLDIVWLQMGGGLVGKGHPPAGRFNAGQKGIFWMTVLGGGAVAVTGYFLIFPFFATDIAGMQLSHMIHSLLAVLMIAGMMAHIYIGTVGMEGAVDAVKSGDVDLNWAKEHHSLWVEEELSKGRVSEAPADGRPA